MNKFINKNLKKKGYKIFKFKDPNIYKMIRKIIDENFNKSTKFYNNLKLNNFRKIVLKCQNEIIKKNIHKKFALSEFKTINKLLDGDTPLYETQLFLRAVRPVSKTGSGEALGWHRETFYSNHQFIKHGINIWFPIKNVNKQNTLKYIHNSHLIDDEKIIRRKIRMSKLQKKNNPNKKFSTAHKLGLVYHAKKIISGINLNNTRKINIPEKSYTLFSAMLVHGNSQNVSNKIRYAIGFGFIPKSKMIRNKIINPKRTSFFIKKKIAYSEYK